VKVSDDDDRGTDSRKGDGSQSYGGSALREDKACRSGYHQLPRGSAGQRRGFGFSFIDDRSPAHGGRGKTRCDGGCVHHLWEETASMKERRLDKNSAPERIHLPSKSRTQIKKSRGKKEPGGQLDGPVLLRALWVKGRGTRTRTEALLT